MDTETRAPLRDVANTPPKGRKMSRKERLAQWKKEKEQSKQAPPAAAAAPVAKAKKEKLHVTKPKSPKFSALHHRSSSSSSASSASSTSSSGGSGKTRKHKQHKKHSAPPQAPPQPKEAPMENTANVHTPMRDTKLSILAKTPAAQTPAGRELLGMLSEAKSLLAKTPRMRSLERAVASASPRRVGAKRSTLSPFAPRTSSVLFPTTTTTSDAATPSTAPVSSPATAALKNNYDHAMNSLRFLEDRGLEVHEEASRLSSLVTSLEDKLMVGDTSSDEVEGLKNNLRGILDERHELEHKAELLAQSTSELHAILSLIDADNNASHGWGVEAEVADAATQEEVAYLSTELEGALEKNVRMCDEMLALKKEMTALRRENMELAEQVEEAEERAQEKEVIVVEKPVERVVESEAMRQRIEDLEDEVKSLNFSNELLTQMHAEQRMEADKAEHVLKGKVLAAQKAIKEEQTKWRAILETEITKIQTAMMTNLQAAVQQVQKLKADRAQCTCQGSSA